MTGRDFSMKIPTALTPAERLARANAASGVSAEVATEPAKAAAPAAPAPAPVAAAPAAKPGLRPWEVAGVSDKGSKKRLPLYISPALRAKLEYLESVGNGKGTMSEIAEAGVLAECLRVEQERGLLPSDAAVKVKPRIVDKTESAVQGSPRRITLMIDSALHERAAALKQLKAVATVADLAVVGIEDECNRRLKARGDL